MIERKPEYFNDNKSGTKIIISNLRSTWTRGTLRETVRLINTLSTPINIKSLDSFRVTVSENLKWTKGLLDVGDVTKQSLFRSKIVLNGKRITEFTYKFVPWNSMLEMNPRMHHEKDIIMKEQVRNEAGKKEFIDIDLSPYEIGEIKIYFYAYSMETNILKLEIEDKTGFKKYIAQNGGVKVYRDGMRVYDYGEKSNDWLGLDIRRVNRPGIYISNNQLIGYVLLNRSQSSDLIEKSNREGFIEDEAYRVFERAILFALRQFELQRNLDKQKLNEFYVSKRTKEPVVRRLSDLRETIESKISEPELKLELQRELVRIEDEYNDMVETFLSSANAGISLGVAVHEIDKVVVELNHAFEKPTKQSLSHAKELAARLTELVKGYSLMLKSKDTNIYDIKSIVNQALFNVDFRLKAHNIQLITNLSDCLSVNLKCSRSISIGSIINLIDNSIWWLGYKEIKNKKIYVGISDDLNHHCTVIVADNGIGYTIPPEDAIRPFVHGRPTGNGIGLGLFIANQCMEDQGGVLIFPEFNDFQIPDDFKVGAITALAFRRTTK